jgi:hypothetical protein
MSGARGKIVEQKTQVGAKICGREQSMRGPMMAVKPSSCAVTPKGARRKTNEKIEEGAFDSTEK